MKKLLLIMVLVLSLSLFASIKVGVVLPMTGGIAAFGDMTWKGIELAHEMYPEVLGEKIELVLVDNRSEKTEAANAVSRVIDKENVVAILGEVASVYFSSGLRAKLQLKNGPKK
ncbi:ABC-type branched-subunit amino acid transport system substrate-binding protein [Marinitoga litoralis]|nr:ABC transporter substrate-binding protein [Marinitoga litoralis]MBM7558973.1 ABC-type branched-subunit amino acid transport system substrate-binding protein [Marinitoga litoralis]